MIDSVADWRRIASGERGKRARVRGADSNGAGEPWTGRQCGDPVYLTAVSSFVIYS
jgi:hypothetical protein